MTNYNVEIIKHPHNRNEIDFGYVYIIQTNSGYKIGQTNNWKHRISCIANGMPIDIDNVIIIESSHYKAKEKALHKTFEQFRIKNEWFDLLPEHIDSILLAESHRRDLISDTYDYQDCDDFVVNCAGFALSFENEYCQNYFYNTAKFMLFEEMNIRGIDISLNDDYITDTVLSVVNQYTESIDEVIEVINLFERPKRANHKRWSRNTTLQEMADWYCDNDKEDEFIKRFFGEIVGDNKLAKMVMRIMFGV